MTSIMTLLYPTYAFILSAIILMFYIHYFVNVPAIECTEDSLYGNDPQKFFDQKVRSTAIIWVVGIIVMVVIFAVILYLQVDYPPFYPEGLPNVDITGSVILLMISLAPFIPATFALMKASYEYDARTMTLLTKATVLVIAVLCIAIMISLTYLPPDNVVSFYNFETIPFLPLSILVLAASLIITYYLSKSAKRSFMQYINDENV